ncbi:MAG: hypothetical protein N2317_04095 [Syntrophales bacterium]|nr:hypothetical protein [Syntrophales bacterium]
MLSEKEVRDRAEYCYLVFYQLSCLRAADVPPHKYLEYLENSSLKLGEDEFIRSIIEEDLFLGIPDGGLQYLITLYEGFTHALCEVLETNVESLRDSIPKSLLEKLATEIRSKEPY